MRHLRLLQSSTVFGTLGPAVVPATLGQDIQCLSGKYEKDCATACVSTSGCSGFLYTAQGSSSGERGVGAGWAGMCVWTQGTPAMLPLL